MAITRAEVLRRAATVWAPGTVPYSMMMVHQPDGYRQDCSGYVSLCWRLPPPGGSTVTMAPPDPSAVMFPITEAELKPGDAIGRCGPGTGGASGHIQLFEGRDPDGTGIWIWEQAGGTAGPRRRKVKTVGQGSGFTPWRFREISDGPPPNEGDGMSYRIRSGAGDGSIYLVPGGLASDGKIAGFAIYGTEYDVLPLVQLPNGVSVPATKMYNINPAPWPAGDGGQHVHSAVTGPAEPPL